MIIAYFTKDKNFFDIQVLSDGINSDRFKSIFNEFMNHTEAFEKNSKEKADLYTQQYMMLDGKVLDRYVIECNALIDNA